MTNMKMDHAFKDYFKVSDHLADLINATSFHGNSIIMPQFIEPYDSDATTLDEQRSISHERRRDVFMKYKNKTGLLLLGIENQTKVDSFMPLRTLIYDAFSYNQMLREHLPLMPIHTVVFYYGESQWYGPQTLKEMFCIPDEFKAVINDWKLHLFSVIDADKNLLKNKDNQKLVECTQKLIKHGYDPYCLKGEILSKNVALVVSSLVNSETFFDIIDNAKEEKIEMCSALRQLESNAEMRGKEIGKMKGVIQTIIKTLQVKFPCLSQEIIVQIEQSNQSQIDLLISQIFYIEKEEDILTLFHSQSA